MDCGSCTLDCAGQADQQLGVEWLDSYGPVGSSRQVLTVAQGSP